MKRFFSKEIIIGLITLVSLFILYFGVNYLKGINLFKPTNHYYVKMKNVMELQKSSPVYIDGFKIGLVNSIVYDFKDQGSIIVHISLDKSMKIQTGSYMEMTTAFTSGSSMNLILNKYVTTYYAVGDTIEGRIKSGLMDKVADDILPQLAALLPRMDSILIGIQALVNHPALIQSFDHIAKTSSSLEASSKQLNSLMSKDIPVIVGDFKLISSNMASVSHNLKQLDLNATMKTADATLKNLQQLSVQLNNKDNSLGLLLNDRMLYDNLNSTAANASSLLLDLKQNPKRYVHFSVFK